jgi:hypothetical protein
MDYGKLMGLSYGERGLAIRICLDKNDFNAEIRRKYKEIKDFSQDVELSESAIYRVLGEVFCLSVDSVKKCLKGKDVNCCFHWEDK